MKTFAQLTETASHSRPAFGNKDGKQPFFGNSQPFFSPSTIQPKLTIGQPNDKYEKEADRVADHVVNSPSPEVQKKCAGCEQEDKVQRQPMEEEEEMMQPKLEIQRMEEEEESLQAKFELQRQPLEEEEELLQPKSEIQRERDNTSGRSIESQLNNSKGQGSPLPESTRSQMESSIGHNFDNVRVHTGSNAIQMNRDIQAKAFTHRNDVYFNQGNFNPGSTDGKRLLAHELTHVVQQTG